jgi:hypothetical protein
MRRRRPDGVGGNDGRVWFHQGRASSSICHRQQIHLDIQRKRVEFGGRAKKGRAVPSFVGNSELLLFYASDVRFGRTEVWR